MGWKLHIQEVDMMNKKKLWCFIQAFSYPLSIMGILVLILLGMVTKTPEIVLILIIIPIGIVVVYLIGSVVTGLFECYEDYCLRIEETKRNDNS